MEITSKFINVGNIKIHYLEAGVGDQVVILLQAVVWIMPVYPRSY